MLPPGSSPPTNASSVPSSISQASSLESAQQQVLPIGQNNGSGLDFRRDSMDAAQKMNSILGNTLNLTSLSESVSNQQACNDRSSMLDQASNLAELLGIQSDPSNDASQKKKEPSITTSPVSRHSSEKDRDTAAVGSRRPIRGNSLNTSGQLEHSTPIRPQISEHLASLLAHGTPFSGGSNFSPVTSDGNSGSSSYDPSLAAAINSMMSTPPYRDYSAYLPSDLGIGSSSVTRSTSPLESDHSALSTGSSSLSVGHLTDLIARLNMGAGSHQPIPRLPSPPPFLDSQQQAFLASLLAGGYNPLALFGGVPLMDSTGIEQNARVYRNAASFCEPTCTWSGQLPPRNYKNPMYSCKIFIGGVPWDITEAALLSAFKPFGPVRVEWPGKEARYARSPVKPNSRGKGYVYMIFENEKSVRALLQNCSQEFGSGGDWYFKLTARRLRTKEIRQVQVIPWVISDSNYVRCPSQRLDPKKTVFVGALHGMITSEILATIMNDLFGNVVYAGIDTDKYKYPIGSGRVTFSNTRSYYKAINAAFVEIKTTKFTKKVQIDPFLEDCPCSICQGAPGPYFCRDLICFRYFCRSCWQTQHGQLEVMRQHKPLMRNTRRSNQPPGLDQPFQQSTHQPGPSGSGFTTDPFFGYGI